MNTTDQDNHAGSSSFFFRFFCFFLFKVLGDVANGFFFFFFFFFKICARKRHEDSFDLYKDGNAVAGTGTYTSRNQPGRAGAFLRKFLYQQTGTDLSNVFYRVTGDDAWAPTDEPIVKVEKNGVELGVVGKRGEGQGEDPGPMATG